MIIVKRDTFKKLLEDNPGKQFAFYEYQPCAFMSELHISEGDKAYPTFGAYSLSMMDEHEDNIIGDPYDWSLNEYGQKDMFAVLELKDVEMLADIFAKLKVDCSGYVIDSTLPALDRWGEVSK